MLRTKLQVGAGLAAVGRVALILSVFISALPLSSRAEDSNTFLSTLNELREASYSEKEAIVDRLARTGHPGVRAVLTGFLEDRLVFRNEDNRIFLIKSGDEDPRVLIDAANLHQAGTAPSETLTTIGTNNGVRRALRSAIARFALGSPDAAVRLNAVRELLKSLDPGTVALLHERRAAEKDATVRGEIDTGLALAELDSPDTSVRLAAVRTLAKSISQDVRNRLADVSQKGPGGSFKEADERVREAAVSAVAGIDARRRFYSGIETLFFGLSLGSVLVLIAIGLAITFGVVGVINMAHGELMMLGAYTTYVVQLAMPQHIGISVLVAIPAAFVVSGMTGVLMERSIIRFLYGRPLETLLATFGVSLILQQAVRSVFSALNRSVLTPDWMSGSLRVNDALAITWNRLYIVIFTLIVFSIVLLVIRRTRLGLDIRAVSQNRAMARAMGIRTEWVDAMTFGLGSGIAGVAGVALSQLTNVGPNLGQSYIIDSFMVVVFGGVGNLWGALIGGMSMGIINNLLEPYAGAVLAKIVVLVALILFIQRRPRGLFPQRGRAAEER